MVGGALSWIMACSSAGKLKITSSRRRSKQKVMNCHRRRKYGVYGKDYTTPTLTIILTHYFDVTFYCRKFSYSPQHVINCFRFIVLLVANDISWRFLALQQFVMIAGGKCCSRWRQVPHCSQIKERPTSAFKPEVICTGKKFAPAPPKIFGDCLKFHGKILPTIWSSYMQDSSCNHSLSCKIA